MNQVKTKEALDKATAKFETEVKNNLKKDKNTGKLYNSIKVGYELREDYGFTINMNMEEYGQWVDSGRKPGKGIPVKQLQKWITQRKLTVQDVNGNTVNMTKSRLNGLSYVINKKIREEGIKPTYFLSDALETFIEELSDKVVNAIADDMLQEITITKK